MNAKLLLKDAEGRILQIKNLQIGIQHEFDVKRLKDGFYFVELQTEKGKSITHQFYFNH